MTQQSKQTAMAAARGRKRWPRNKNIHLCQGKKKKQQKQQNYRHIHTGEDASYM